MEEPVDEVLSILETPNVCLSFPNLQGSEEKEAKEGNDEEKSPNMGKDDEDKEEEDEKGEDAKQEVKDELQDKPAQEGSTSANEVGSIFPLLLYTIFYY